MHFNFVRYRKIYFIFTGILILSSIVCLIIFGLKLGIDFTGGSILEVEFKEARPANQAIREKLANFDLGEFTLQSVGERGVLIRMRDISSETQQEILQKLRQLQGLEEKRFESIGPTIGQELKEKIKIVITLALLSMVLYIAFAFRRVSRPIKSWQYGIAALIIISHDILIPLGVFSILGKFYGVQITIPVIVALLTVVGYAINNVVVVFDRIRENLFKKLTITFEEAINFSINQTLTRQLNTSLTTLFPLIFIFFIGGETLKYFALALMLGITVGTYSSIFLASPILVSWLKWRHRAVK